MGTDAKVTLGVDGADDVARAADRALRPWTSAANTAKGAVQSMGSAVSDVFRQATSDIARGVTAFAAFDFGSKLPAVISYREEVARLSVVAGQSTDALRQRFAAQEAVTLSARTENEKFAQSFGRLTYNYKEATSAADAFGNEALASNRALGDMAHVGKVIYDAVGSLKDAPDVLGRIRAQADALKTSGGPDALRDQLEGLGGVMNRLAQQSPQQLGQLTATLGGLGKGLRPDPARAFQAQIIGQITGDTMKTERFLRSGGVLGKGETILDERGQIKNLPDVIARYQAAWRGQAGSEAEARRLARLHFGDVGGAAFMNFNAGEAMDLAGAAPSTGARDAADQLRNSEEGQRKLKQIQAAGAQQDIAATALPAVDAVLGFAREHPLAAGAGALLAPGIVAKGSSWLLGAGVKALFGGGAAAGAGSGTAAAAGGLATGGGVATTSALDAAAAGGWLSPGATAVGAGIMAPLATLAAGIYGTGKVLHEVGEDRDVMGRKYRATHGGVETLEAFGKAKRAAAMAESGDEAFTAYQTARAAGASREDAEEIARVIQAKLDSPTITIINQTGGPIEAIAKQSATDASGQQ